jgi:hypothetical protein
MIDIVSYEGVCGIGYGEREESLIAAFGQPLERGKNREGETELRYKDIILRLEASSDRFREITLLPECPALVSGIRVTWSRAFLGCLQVSDPDLVEVLGFIFSRKLGVALSGFHDDDRSQMAIHAFRRGDWDRFSKWMKPFRFVV